MSEIMDEAYGKQTLANIFSYIWLGEWDQYDKAFSQMPEELIELFPFHMHYNREGVSLWHENYFYIPGDFFIPPYYSAYAHHGATDEIRKHNLLSLIGMYEQFGFYFPVEKGYYPDHVGCMTAFISSAIQGAIKALEKNDFRLAERMHKAGEDMRQHYIEPTIEMMLQRSDDQITHPFFKSFLKYYAESMHEEWSLPVFS